MRVTMGLRMTPLMGPIDEMKAKNIDATNTTNNTCQGKEKGIGSCVNRILREREVVSVGVVCGREGVVVPLHEKGVAYCGANQDTQKGRGKHQHKAFIDWIYEQEIRINNNRNNTTHNKTHHISCASTTPKYLSLARYLFIIIV